MEAVPRHAGQFLGLAYYPYLAKKFITRFISMKGAIAIIVRNSDHYLYSVVLAGSHLI